VAAHLASAHNVRFARGAITAHLTLVIAKGNEQDPVRNAMLTGLAGLPPSIWREEHLQQIERIQRQALDARDLSIPAAAQLERILVGLIPLYPGWAALQLAVLVRERGRLSFWSLESRISDDQMRVIGPQIYAVLKSWADRDHGPLLNAMSSFGRRLRAWDPGARLLADFCKTGHRNLALTGAQILSKYRPDIFRELAPELLKQDETWGVKPVIYNYLHLHRQDLWTPALLGRANLEGAFWYSKTRFVLPLAAGFHRWNPLQQQLFAKTLTAVVRDADRDSPGAIWAILRLAALPDVEPATVLQLASLENEKLVLREASLRALCRLDGGQGVPVLVEALDDERARIAVYSLRRALLEMPEGRAIGILRATPLAKVTVAKEVIRLLGELKSPEALELVMEFAGGELHRDVRIALLRALWDHLEDERVWPILEAAAVDSDAAVARMAARTPAVRLTTTARVRLRALRAQLLVHPEPRVRLEVMAVMSLADYDPESLLLQPLIEALGSPIEQEYLGAANAIFLRYATTDAIGQAVAKLRPRRRALQQVLRAFSGRALWSPRSAIVGLAKKIMAELEADPLLDSERIKLAYEFLDQEEFAVKVEDMLSAGRVHPGIWSGLIELLESPRGGRNIMDQLQDLQAKWSSHESPELRRLGLAALVAESRYVYGWNQNRLESLQNYRNDPAPLVASAAQWIFPDGRDVEFPLGSVMEASERDSK